MSIIIKSSTRINSKTSIGGVAASAPSADILSSWGVAYVSGVGVTLTDVAGYTVPAGTDAIITGPLNLNDGVTLTVADTATLTIN
jgi:hypothetical protein